MQDKCINKCVKAVGCVSDFVNVCVGEREKDRETEAERDRVTERQRN